MNADIEVGLSLVTGTILFRVFLRIPADVGGGCVAGQGETLVYGILKLFGDTRVNSVCSNRENIMSRIF